MPLSALLSNPVFLVPTVLLVTSNLFYAIAPESAVTTLSLVVSNTFMGYFFIWTVVTSCFLESSIIKVIVDVFLLVVIVKQLEGLQDHLRMALYTLITAVGISLATSVTLFVGFVITRMEDLLFSPTMGFGGIIMAYLVLLKQKIPSDTVFKGLPSFRVRHLPFTWLSISILARLLGAHALTKDLPLIAWAFPISWQYLRFGQHNADGTMGDIQEDFQFVTMFPQFMHKYLGPFFNFSYGVSVLLGYCKDRELAMAANIREDAGPELPNVYFTKQKNDPIAERRRAKAMKVLDAKLAALAKETTGAPSGGGKDLEEAAGEASRLLIHGGDVVVVSRNNVDVDIKIPEEVK